MSDVELLGLLPGSPWRTDALFLAKYDADLNKERWLAHLSNVAPYLKRVAIVLAEARKALEDRFAIASQAGSFQQPKPENLLAQLLSASSPHLRLEHRVKERLVQGFGDIPRTSPYRCTPPSWSPKAVRYSSPVSPLVKALMPDPLQQHLNIQLRWLRHCLSTDIVLSAHRPSSWIRTTDDEAVSVPAALKLAAQIPDVQVRSGCLSGQITTSRTRRR